MVRCGLYSNSGDLQPLQSVDVSCTVREDFACQVKLTQVFKTAAQRSAVSIKVVDTDGDKIELQISNIGAIQELVNGSIALRSVQNFEFDCNTGRYEDAGGHGHIPAADRLLFARKLKWLFQITEKDHYLTIENEPPEGLKPLSEDEIPKTLVETSYYFPLDGNAAVYAFRATLEDGSVVDGIVQEKNEAKQTYEKAKKAGKTAFLMEREKSDIFQISLGNVTAGEEIKIEISYIAELEMRDGRIRLRIPNRIAPKCGGGPSTRVDYPINFDFAIRTSTRIGKIEALGGVDLQTDMIPGDEKAAHVTASREGYMNEDLVLMISQDSPYGIYTTLERSYQLKSECLRLTFNNPINTDTDMDGKCEIIFLVDKSGSMSGDRMNTTKFALTLFLRSLPEQSKFNIVAFDRSWNSCFENSIAYNDGSLQLAQTYVDRIDASGGTNIKGPLEDVLKAEEDPDYPRSIILLTDGEVNDTRECIEAARKGGCRIFTIGVGRSFSQELVEGIATASSGSWLAVHNTDDMGNVVMQMLGNALKPMVCKCKADMGPFGGAEMWPSKFPQLMDGVRTTLYWVRPMQEEGSEPLPPKFTIKLDGYYNNGDVFKKELQVITGDFEGITESQLNRSKQEVDSIVHRVAALSKIKKLETERSKNAHNVIRDLGLKYNLATSQTSFVAVRENETFVVGERMSLAEGRASPSRQGRPTRQGTKKPAVVQNFFRHLLHTSPATESRARRRRTSGEKNKHQEALRALETLSSKSRADRDTFKRSMATSIKRTQPPSESRGVSFGGVAATFSESVESHADPLPQLPDDSDDSDSSSFLAKAMPNAAISDDDSSECDMPMMPGCAYSGVGAAISTGTIPSLLKKLSGDSDSDDQFTSKSTPSNNYVDIDVALSKSREAKSDSASEMATESMIAPFAAPPMLDDLSEEAEMSPFSPDPFASMAPVKVSLDFNWLLSQQSASGMFKFAPSDPRFSSYSSKNINSAVAEKLVDQNVLNGVLATLFALAALTHEFAARKTEWQFMFAKGKRWVTKQLTNKDDFNILLALLE